MRYVLTPLLFLLPRLTLAASPSGQCMPFSGDPAIMAGFIPPQNECECIDKTYAKTSPWEVRGCTVDDTPGEQSCRDHWIEVWNEREAPWNPTSISGSEGCLNTCAGLVSSSTPWSECTTCSVMDEGTAIEMNFWLNFLLMEQQDSMQSTPPIQSGVAEGGVCLEDSAPQELADEIEAYWSDGAACECTWDYGWHRDDFSAQSCMLPGGDSGFELCSGSKFARKEIRKGDYWNADTSSCASTCDSEQLLDQNDRCTSCFDVSEDVAGELAEQLNGVVPKE